MIRYLSQQDVTWACAQIDAVECVRRALELHSRGESILPNEAYLGWPVGSDERARSLNMPGALTDGEPVIGTKIINANPGNPARGLARASGVTLLFDPVTAQVRTVMAAAHISALRTACVTALSVQVLAASHPRCLALLGAGALARAHFDLLSRRLPELRTVTLFDLHPDRAVTLAESWRRSRHSHLIDIRVTGTAEAAVRAAELVVPVTTTTEPYLRLDWLRPGALLVNVSLDDAMPEVLLRTDRLVVDDWHLVTADEHRLLGRLYRAGQVTGPAGAGFSPPVGPDGTARPRAVDAELGQILTGDRPGREHPDEIIVVNPFGLAIEDLAIAAKVDELARRTGRGVDLDP